jgi:hypothetical protein
MTPARFFGATALTAAVANALFVVPAGAKYIVKKAIFYNSTGAAIVVSLGFGGVAIAVFSVPANSTYTSVELDNMVFEATTGVNANPAATGIIATVSGYTYP